MNWGPVFCPPPSMRMSTKILGNCLLTYPSPNRALTLTGTSHLGGGVEGRRGPSFDSSHPELVLAFDFIGHLL